MRSRSPIRSRPTRMRRALASAGVIALVAGLGGSVLGLILIETLGRDLRASMEVTHSAVVAVGQTIELTDQAAARIDESLDAAAGSVSGAAATARSAVTGLEDVAEFLDGRLPEDLEAINQALPGAIQAASAIDGALSALALFGVDYDPDEPFDESLRRVESALADLPDELREQSAALRGLVPSAGDLAGDADRLALALNGLNDDLAGFQELTATYRATVDEARMTVEQSLGAFDGRAWLMRLLVAALGLAGVAVGVALIMVGANVEGLQPPEMIERPALPARAEP